MLAKVAGVVLMCVIVVAIFAPHAAEGITCNQISGALVPCLGYLRGGPLGPRCCPGVKSIVNIAKTPADRQTACRCLQSAAKSFGSTINLGNAAALPGKCGVNIPYKISPNTDCSKIR